MREHSPLVILTKDESRSERSQGKKLVFILFVILVVAASQLLQGHYHVNRYLQYSTSHVKAKLNKFRSGSRINTQGNSSTISAQEYPSVTINPILNVLQKASIPLTSEIVEKVRPFSDFTGMYGDQPVIIGLDKCEEFRQQISAPDRTLAIAGMFNTGTNILDRLLTHNCVNPERERSHTRRDEAGILWQVAWGKHSPASYRLVFKNEWSKNLNESQALPIVVVKDPYFWMESLCRHPYSAIWKHSPDRHCPNLIPNEVDKSLGFVRDEEHEKELKENGIPLVIRYASPRKKIYSNMAGAWNTWYSDYVNADYPRLIVRFEDLLIHAKTVVTQACHCFGGEIIDNDNFKYQTESAKANVGAHRGSSGFVEALLQYSNADNRTQLFTTDDLLFAKRVLNKTMMEMFHYSTPSTPR